jgi:dTDP-glucose 4,6-dehydratase
MVDGKKNQRTSAPPGKPQGLTDSTPGVHGAEKTIFVTGGAGFIGSGFVHIVDQNRPTWQTIIFDKLTYAGRRENLAGLSDHHRLVVGDICDKQAVREAMQGSNVVVHFAAESHVTRSEDDPDRFYRTNVEGTRTILEVAKDLVLPVVHISTDEVYGPITNGYFKETDKQPGDGQATSAYAKSKALADDLAQTAAASQPVMIIRPTNNYGPRQYPEKALPRWITNLVSGGTIPLWGDGQQVRDWLFVEDTARAVLGLLEQGSWGEIYNLGANHNPEITNRQAAELVCDTLGLPHDRITHIPDPRPDHDVRYGVDTTKLQKLGFQSATPFSDGLRQTLQWYVGHPKWWQAIKAEAESIYEKKESGLK